MKKLALLVAALFACAASAASAAAPTVVESYVNRDVTLPAGSDFCAFPIAAHVEGFRRVTTFTDNDGNVVKTTILLHAFPITYTNPLSGKRLSTPLAGPVIGEPQPDGTWLVRIPGNDGRFVTRVRASSSRTSASGSASRKGRCRRRRSRRSSRASDPGRERVPRRLLRPRVAVRQPPAVRTILPNLPPAAKASYASCARSSGYVACTGTETTPRSTSGATWRSRRRTTSLSSSGRARASMRRFAPAAASACESRPRPSRPHRRR